MARELEEDGLQENSRVVGAHLKAGLQGLMDRHELVGDEGHVRRVVGVLHQAVAGVGQGHDERRHLRQHADVILTVGLDAVVVPQHPLRGDIAAVRGRNYMYLYTLLSNIFFLFKVN